MPLTKNSPPQKQTTPNPVDEEYSQNGLFYDVFKTALSCATVIAIFCTELSFYATTQINYKYLAIAITALLLRIALDIYEQNK